MKNFADKFIKLNTQINTDESTAYDVLLPYYNLRTVNHKEEYRSDLGVTNNQAESLFSRFKRMYYGQVHRISNELSRCLKTTNDNNEWCGYWQRKIIHQEVIWQ